MFNLYMRTWRFFFGPYFTKQRWEGLLSPGFCLSEAESVPFMCLCLCQFPGDWRLRAQLLEQQAAEELSVTQSGSLAAMS